MRYFASAACVLVSLASPARALDCHDGFPYTGGQYGVAAVTAAERAYFYSAAPPCPDGAGCRMAAYLVPGDLVITGPAQGSGLCVLYPGETRTTFGVIHKSDLGPAKPVAAHPAISEWAGTWKKGDDQITLRADDDSVVANGDAYWPSANPPLDQQPGGPNIGEMAGKAQPDGNTLTYASSDPNDCRVSMTLVTPFLMVQDNNKCGGRNATFTGLYRRIPSP
jgi:hypothetical protein